MIIVTQQDVTVIRMAVDTLLESVRQTERWWRADDVSVKRQQMQKPISAILATRRKFVKGDEAGIDNALMVAEGLREAALHCSEGQAALHTRLITGADTIERLCRRKD